ncbi:hypothetical protein DB354_01170 [Opitutus sp. ER46]|nr:hypothetical protein DB354_01170 [Opitutus sp. ER46]
MNQTLRALSLSSSVTSVSPPPPRRRVVLLAAGLFLGTVLLFLRGTTYGFVNYDDPAYVTANPHVQAGLTWSGVVWAFTAPADYWHPLTWLSHLLDWQLYGAAAGGHHVTSVLWHALNAVLAFLVFQRLGLTALRAAFAAALFAWHPLRVESVVWITERKDVMSGACFLLTLLAYAGYVERRAAGRPAATSYALTLAAFAAGLMCKPMLVTLPLVLLILDVWPFRRAGSRGAFARLVLEKLPFLLLAAAVAALTVLMQRQVGAFVLEVPLTDRVGNAVVALARYLGKLAWPSDLIVCYAHPGSWPVLIVAGAAALLLALAALAWRQRHTRPWVAAGLAWFVVTLLPVLGLVQVGFQSLADRYTYLPLLGVVWAVVASLPAFASARGRAVLGLAAASLLAALAVRTWTQQATWRDSVTLFTHAVTHSPGNEVAEDLLSSALLAEGRLDEAAHHAERALALNPRRATAAISLASVRERQGRLDEAKALYRTALAIQPPAPELQAQLALLELATGEPAAARARLVPALVAAPGLRAPTLQLGQDALQRGDLVRARFLFEVLIAAYPREVDARVGLGTALIRSGQPTAGREHWRRALELDPAYPGLREAIAPPVFAPRKLQ